jgi:hypothetical protein
MASGFFLPSLGPIPTYLIAWGLFLLIPPTLILPRFFGKFRLPLSLGIDEPFYHSWMVTG